MKESLKKLCVKWRKDADQYQSQLEEARSKSLPCDQTLAMMTQLRICAFELEAKIKDFPSLPVV
jgi:hypothetical protein